MLLHLCHCITEGYLCLMGMFPLSQGWVSPDAVIGDDVVIGHGAVVHAGVTIGPGTVIGSYCIIGEAPGRSVEGKQLPTVIGAGSVIRSHTVLYAGSVFGDGFQTGHHAVVRERCVIGDHCAVGTFSDLQGHIVMGEYCRLHSNVHLAQGTRLGSFVFMYPFAVTTNDRFPPTTVPTSPVIGDYTQVGVHAVIIAGVNVGAHCLIAANSTVTRDTGDHAFMVGSPAIRRKDVRELCDADGSPLYPWKERFDRGMPWSVSTEP